MKIQSGNINLVEDQTTIKVVYTQEANAECEQLMKSKAFFINASGQNIRYTELEVIQTMFTMTKEPTSKDRTLPEQDKKNFLELPMEEYTFSNIVKWFGDTTDTTDGRNTTVTKSKFNMTDKMTLTKSEYPYVDSTTPIQTTLGRFLYNKLVLEDSGVINYTRYINLELVDKNYNKVQRLITDGLINDHVTVEQMYRYTDRRDWVGLQLHGVITTSFTMSSLKVPKEVQKLKKDLLKEYKTELENGDPVASEKVEKALVSKTKEVMKGDIGMDLYLSGARGSIGNNYKNMYLYRGAIKNNVTGKYDIVQNSLTDGLEKKDIAAHSNSIIAGAFPKGVGTRVSGYLSKQLISAMQSEVLAEEGSDCGSKGYITIKIPENKWDDFLYRYIVVGDKLVNLDENTIKKYIGKVVKLRSPMYCIGYGKEKCLCNKCAGDFYYKIGKKYIGLLCSRPAETTKRLSMKKFHSNLITTFKIDVDDMMI